jgi:hypothetical protein
MVESAEQPLHDGPCSAFIKIQKNNDKFLQHKTRNKNHSPSFEMSDIKTLLPAGVQMEGNLSQVRIFLFIGHQRSSRSSSALQGIFDFCHLALINMNQMQKSDYASTFWL